jgi:hypothetical protein
MTTEQHWQHFEEFCIFEKMTGGPDPHMKAVLKMCEGLPPEEKLWRTALYVGFYNVPSAEAMWRSISGESYLAAPLLGPLSWLDKHWKGLRTRKERRTVKSPERMDQYLVGYAETFRAQKYLANSEFDEVWSFAKGLPHVGRYAATKLVEMWYQLGFTKVPHADIRAAGGWSPRSAIAVLFPDAKHDPYDKSKTAIADAENMAKTVHAQLTSHGTNISVFELEVMLCEYKASYSTHRQHPGKSLDSELTYEAAIKDYWKFGDTDHMRVRPLISPTWSLGEIQGWDGVRKELGFVLADFGYTWSDYLYDYKKTTDLRNPVRREHGTEVH